MDQGVIYWESRRSVGLGSHLRAVPEEDSLTFRFSIDPSSAYYSPLGRVGSSRNFRPSDSDFEKKRPSRVHSITICTPFLLLFGISYFFAEFGPNETTFVLAGEVFPTRIPMQKPRESFDGRDGISSASRKPNVFMNFNSPKPS